MQSSLFKYQTLNVNSLASLASGTVWLAKPGSFNDPLDCALTLDRLKYKESVFHAISVALERAKPSGLKREHLFDVWPGDAEAFESLREKIKSLFQSFGFLCLTEVPDCTLMWSHYASHHRGFCVEYDFTADSLLRSVASKVKYADQIPSISAADLAEVNRRDAIDALWLTKAKCWSYEREWRVMTTRGDQSYVAPSPVRSVTFGARMPTADRELIAHVLRDSLNTEFREALISEGQFTLAVRKI